MPHLTPDQIITILASGRFDDLRSVIEDDQVEAKSEPYPIGTLRGNLELAKDVTSFANARGGVILIGARTERSPIHRGDEIREPRPLQEGLVDQEQYHAVLRNWVFPQIEGLDIRWYPSAQDNERGIVAILIPNQPEIHRPFLVAHTVDEGDRQIDIVFGYGERRRGGVEPMRVQDLQILLKDGRRFGELQDGFDAINTQLQTVLQQQHVLRQQLLEQRETVQAEPQLPLEPAVSPDVLHTRLDQAIAEAGLQERPIFLLAVVPLPAVEFPTLFQDGSALTRALEHPPRLRPGGFDVSVGSAPRIVRGQLRRAVSPGNRILELWREGTLIFVTEAEDFLCWGTRVPGGPLRINPLALCESTYGFADLARVVFGEAQPAPQGMIWTLWLQHMTLQGQPAQVIPGPLGTMAARFGMEIHGAPDVDLEVGFRWDHATVHPGAVSYRLVREVYRWFGIQDEGIPYTEPSEHGPAIDANSIRRAQS